MFLSLSILYFEYDFNNKSIVSSVGKWVLLKHIKMSKFLVW